MTGIFHPKQLSIRTKVYLALTLSLVLIFGLLAYLLINNTSNLLKSNLNEESKSFASLATAPIGNAFITYQNSGTFGINEQVQNQTELDPDITEVRVVSTSGQILFSNQTQPMGNIAADQAMTFSPVLTYDSSGYIRQVIEPLVEQTGVHEYAIVYNISTARVLKDIDHEVELILLAAVTLLIISVLGTSIMMNRMIIEPLRSISRSAGIISLGNYDQEISYRHKDEIGNLAVALNTMASSLKADIVKLQELDKLKSEFMMVTSHNLRTPLTVIRSSIEMADEVDSIETLKHLVKGMSSSVNRLHILAEDMLTVSTLEAGEQVSKAPVKLKSFLQSIDNEMAILAKDGQINWEFQNEISDDLQLEISQTNLRTALVAILDNAIKFTKAGGSVKTIAKIEGSELFFGVTDTGIGIEEAEKAKLFTKFHRGTSTLNYNYEGEGVGLYLAKLVVEQHGGSISIDSQLDKGTTCIIKLPLNPPNQPAPEQSPN